MVHWYTGMLTESTGCDPSVRGAAQALAKKLRECEPHISSAFVLGHVHGQRYNGPTYGEELKALEDALARTTEIPW